MSMIKKIATAGAVAAMGLGLGAASASAYSISGGSYTGTTAVDHSFTVGGFYTITCPAADTEFNGTADGSATTSFVPSYGGTDACEFFGFPATVSQSGNWDITVTSDDGLPTPTWYYGQIDIPSTSTTTINVPLAACTVTVNGPQTFAHGGGPAGGNVGQAMNDGSGNTDLDAVATGIVYSAAGSCPFSSSNDGEYNTNGSVHIPGVTVS